MQVVLLFMCESQRLCLWLWPLGLIGTFSLAQAWFGCIWFRSSQVALVCKDGDLCTRLMVVHGLLLTEEFSSSWICSTWSCIWPQMCPWWDDEAMLHSTGRTVRSATKVQRPLSRMMIRFCCVNLPTLSSHMVDSVATPAPLSAGGDLCWVQLCYRSQQSEQTGGGICLDPLSRSVRITHVDCVTWYVITTHGYGIDNVQQDLLSPKSWSDRLFSVHSYMLVIVQFVGQTPS